MKLKILISLLILTNNATGQCIDCNSFEEALQQPKKVKTLKINPWIHNVTLDSIPTSIGKFVNAKIIYLSGHNVTYIPKSIGNLKKLKELSFAECKLQLLPDEIFQLTNLQELILVNNEFSDEYIVQIKKRFTEEMPNTKLMISRAE